MPNFRPTRPNELRTENLERRQFLTLSAASFAAALMPRHSRAQEVPAASFSFDKLVERRLQVRRRFALSEEGRLRPAEPKEELR